MRRDCKGLLARSSYSVTGFCASKGRVLGCGERRMFIFLHHVSQFLPVTPIETLYIRAPKTLCVVPTNAWISLSVVFWTSCHTHIFVYTFLLTNFMSRLYNYVYIYIHIHACARLTLRIVCVHSPWLYQVILLAWIFTIIYLIFPLRLLGDPSRKFPQVMVICLTPVRIFC